MKYEDWTPSLTEYDPNISSEDWLKFLNEKIKDNQRMLTALARIMDNGGEFICTEIANKYGDNMALFRNFITTYFGKYASEYFNVSAWKDDTGSEKNWSIISQIKDCTNKEIGSFKIRLRNNLKAALEDFGISNYFSYGNQDISCIITNMTWNSNGWKGLSNDKSNFGYVKSGNTGYENWNFDFDNPRNIDDKIYGFIQFSRGAPKTASEYSHLVIMSSENQIVGVYGKAMILKKPEKIEDNLLFNICGLKDYCVYFENPIDNTDKKYLEGGERIGQGGFNYLTDKKNILAILNEAKRLNPDESIKIEKMINWVTENKIIGKDEKKNGEGSIDGGNIMSENKIPLNQILYGPPGTGKTYFTKEMAVKICDGKYYAENEGNREKIVKRYKELVGEKRIVFTTFHQSLSYEDFIEGIKPVTKDEDGVELETMAYKVLPGIFKRICEKAQKSSEIRGTDNFDDAWQKTVDYLEEHESATIKTLNGKSTFDLILNATGTGLSTKEDHPKFFSKEQMYRIYKGERGVPAGGHDNYRKAVVENFMKNKKEIGLKEYIAPEKTEVKLPYLLIIDEINRGNIPQIFGELITLIEESKRQGAKDEVSVTLPYSGEKFSVPSNLYILGTMNTADRSVEALDTALRRRFNFVPMMPDPSKLGFVGDIDLSEMLTAINERLEYLLDKDHTIGHAYFMNADDKPLTLDDLCSIFENKIIPQLQEYFYNDMKKIQMILGEAFVSQKEVSSNLFKIKDDSYFEEKELYEITSSDSWDEASFIGIYE